MVPVLRIEALNAESIKAAISAENAVRLSLISIFQKINSTNTYLNECAKKENISHWCCIADTQTQGRGRLHKKWHSEKGGNIYLSIALPLTLAPTHFSSLALVVAIAMVRAFAKVSVPLKIKWPNDLWFEAKKLGGILIETVLKPNQPPIAIIGVGVNLFLAPENKVPGWTAVSDMTDRTISRNQVIGFFIDELYTLVDRYQKSGLTTFLSEWQGYDGLYGKSIVMTSHDKEVVGTMRGISRCGELLLLTKQGEVEVFHVGEAALKILPLG
jgi:BirA family biotin operon repressor/biotin-[acetyl-CoA-carboxylase] ligase